MATNQNRNNRNNSRNRNNYKDYALDKFDVDVSQSSKKKNSAKIKGRPKNPFVRFAVAAFPQAKDTGAEKARKGFLLFAVACLLGAFGFLAWQLLSLGKAGEKNREIADLAGLINNNASSSAYQQPGYIANPTGEIPTTSGTAEPEFIDLTPVVNEPLYVDFDSLKSVNPDTRAWIKITGTAIDNVVVQSNDNSYYLDHDFYGDESISGTIFSTYLNNWDGTDDNTILFGHNMATGDFFAYVMHYVPDDLSREPLAFYKVHPTILMSTPDGGSETYKIFAGIIANTEEQYGEVFDYTTKTQFSGYDDFNSYITGIMDRSWFYTDVDLTYGDKLLTLSTCYWPMGKDVDTRWVLFARKVRPGESETVDTSVATRNYGAKMFDYYYEVYGGDWYGSSWDTSKLH